MRRRFLWLSGPLILGILTAVLVLVVPAQAGKTAQVAASPSPALSMPGSETFGEVESFPQGLIGAWTVDGKVYTADEQTNFWPNGGQFAVGACVWLRFDPATHNANDIGLIQSDHCGKNGGKQRFTGLIEQVPEADPTSLGPSPGISGTWVIGGIEFVSTMQTRLNTHNGPLDVGACATVRYQVVNGVNMADEIRNTKVFHCLGSNYFNQAYGTVVSFPQDLVGEWVISDTTGMSLTFMTTPSSRVWPLHFPLEVGACIKVKYYPSADLNIAGSVKTENPQVCESHFLDLQPWSKIYATVDSLPPTTTMTGTWVLAGVNFTSTGQTRIEEEEGPLAVDSCAEAKYDPGDGAMLLHKLEGEEPSDCQAEDGSDLFKLYGVVEVMPTTGYTGTWQVSGVSFTVNPSTTVESRHGEFMTGAFVKVNFTYDEAAGERTALVLKTHVAPGFGRMNLRGRFDGWLLDPSGDQIVLDGSNYALDPAADRAVDIQAGDMVWVNLYQGPDGTFVTQVSQDQTVYLPVVRQ